MNSASDDAALPAPGCPIRRSSAHSPLSGSPKLFAASHVLHRLLAPRHPPYALSSLTNMPNYQVYALLDPDLLCTRMQLSKTKRRRPRSGLDPRCVPRMHAPRIQTLDGVELIGIEPTTSALQGRRSPS